MRAVEISRYGGPEVLEVVDVDPPSPGAGQVLIDVEVAGINYIDTYQRSGTGHYRGQLPARLGVEGAGIVRKVGDGSGDILPSVGTPVAWKAGPGSYAEQVVVDAGEVVPLPEGVPTDIGAAVMLQGLTAHYLCVSTYPVAPGDVALVHAAAGGVGLLLTQMVRMRGGHVIGTVSSDAKASLSREAGADLVVRYDREDVVSAVREFTGGAGVAVAYDGVGQATFDASLASLRRRGFLVLYGAASGQVPPVDLQRLNLAGSAYVTRPTLGDYTSSREELMERCHDLFAWVRDGRLKVRVGAEYPLAAVGEAHRDLQGRRTVGKLLLRVS